MAMKFERFNERMEYLEDLIKRQATGTPKELASKLGLSERMVYRYIHYYIEKGNNIEFSRTKKTYRFTSH
jgi:predicted DNA-binding transcriptional regulator YafY